MTSNLIQLIGTDTLIYLAMLPTYTKIPKGKIMCLTDKYNLGHQINNFYNSRFGNYNISS